MKIGLVDVDNHNWPNLALMKISSWHKGAGDTVEWAGSLEHYDIVYMAKVFTFTSDDIQSYQADKIVKGGTGYDLTRRLPKNIECAFPDYDLYGIKDMVYGYLTRGCPRKCPFCIVGQKEGVQTYKVADLSQFWRGQKHIKLLDPNLLAAPEWRDLLGQLADSGAWVDFTQGLDIRLMTDEKAAAWGGTAAGGPGICAGDLRIFDCGHSAGDRGGAEHLSGGSGKAGIGVRRLLRGGDACDHCSYRRNLPPEAAGGADGGVPPHQRGKLCRS